METVKISPKFQVVIPKKLRDALRLSPRQRVQMVIYGNRIEMIPLRMLSEMRGFLKGINTTVERDPDRLSLPSPSMRSSRRFSANATNPMPFNRQPLCSKVL